MDLKSYTIDEICKKLVYWYQNNIKLKYNRNIIKEIILNDNELTNFENKFVISHCNRIIGKFYSKKGLFYYLFRTLLFIISPFFCLFLLTV